MRHESSLALIRFLSNFAKKLGVAQHVYVVGGAVRNFVMDPTGQKYPVKDIDVVIDSLSAGRDSEWFARQLAAAIPVATNLATNQYGVALLHITGEWVLEGENLQGEDIEIANARKESYADGGYTPSQVDPATLQEDVLRRDFTFNSLMWRLLDLAEGPDKAQVIDLTGCGVRDLQNREMNCPKDPDVTFADDPSRMLRAVKFLVKYNLKPSPDVRASILRNLPKLKNIPPSHLASILVNTFLRDPKGKRALHVMGDLGLLDAVKLIVQGNKVLRDTLGNWADRESKVEFLFDLMDFGLPSGKRLSYLSTEQLGLVRKWTVQMTAQEADEYVQALNQPGKVMDTRALMSEFDLKGAEVGQLTQTAREHLIRRPEYMSGGLTEAMRLSLGGKRLAETVARRAVQAAPRFKVDPIELYRFLMEKVLHRELTRWTSFDFDGVRFEVINPEPQLGFRRSLRIRLLNSKDELVWSSPTKSWRKTKRLPLEEAPLPASREESDWERDFYRKSPEEQIDFLQGLPRGVLPAMELREERLKPAVLRFLSNQGYRF